jgi:hypothetical protein
MVTFSKKAQTAGYYFGDRALIPDKAYRQFNTSVFSNPLAVAATETNKAQVDW